MSSVITGSTPPAPYSCYRLWVLLHPHPLHKVSRDNVQKMKITISFCKVTKVQTGPSKSFQSPPQTLKSSSPNVVFLRLATRLRAAGRLQEHAIIPGTGMVRIPPVIVFAYVSFESSVPYCLFLCIHWVVFAILSFSLYPLSCLCLCIFWVVTMTVMAWQNTNTWCVLSTSGVFRGRPWERAVWTCHGRCGESREELPFIKQGFRWSQNGNVNFQWTLWRNCNELPLRVV